MNESELYPFTRVRHVIEALDLAGNEETQVYGAAIALGYQDESEAYGQVAYGQVCVWRIPYFDNPTQSRILVTLRFLASSGNGTEDEVSTTEVDDEREASCGIYPNPDLDVQWTLDDIIARWRFQPDAPIWFWATPRPPEAYETP